MQNHHSPKQSNQNQSGALNLGNQAPVGMEGTGEHFCRGSGRRDRALCATCGGTGWVIEGISGA